MYWRYGCFTRLGVNSAFSTDTGLLVVDEDEEDVSWMRIEIKVSRNIYSRLARDVSMLKVEIRLSVLARHERF